MIYLTNFVLILIGLVLIFTLGTIIFLIQLVRKPLRKEDLSSYLRTIAVGLDQFGGSIIYGTEDWCISSIAYKHYTEGRNIWFMKLINFLFKDENHCKNSYESESKVIKEIKDIKGD